MISNINMIRDMLHFPEGEFYFIQILQRRKDGHTKNGNNRNRLIKAYFVDSLDHYDKIKDEIIQLCQFFQARAMIHLSRRSKTTVALQTLQLQAEMIAGGNIDKVFRAYTTACGRNKGVNRTWIVDLDDLDLVDSKCNEISDFINSLEPMGSKVLKKIASKSGVHIITKPFNLAEFSFQYTDIEVHKNNPTNLYSP